MQITLGHSELAGAVASVVRALPARPTDPILAGIRLCATGQLTLSAFDYEVSAQASLPASVAAAGDVVVSGRLLAEIVRSLPAKEVELSADSNRLYLKCGAARFTLMILPLSEYPQLPVMPPLAGTIGSDTLAEAATQVAMAASRDDTIPALTGVRIEADGDTITLVATDRYRLAIRQAPWSPAQPGTATAVLVPARVLAEVARTAADAAETSIFLAPPAADAPAGIAGFEAAGHATTTRLLGGDYPRYQTLIPSQFTGHAELPADTFTAAVRRVALVAARDTPVRLTFEPDLVQLEAGSGDEARATEEVEATFDGPAGFQAAFNPHYLVEGITATGASRVHFSLTSPTKPALLTAKNPAEDSGYRYILMPIRTAG